MLQVFCVTTIPVAHSFLLFLSASLLFFGLREFRLLAVLLVLSFYLFFTFFFCYFYFTFPSIWFYTLLWHLVICLFLLFFLLSRARMLRMPFIYAWSVRGHPSHRHHSPQIFCDGHVATTPSLWPFPPHTCLPQICTAHPSITLFALFCVCYVPMHSPAPI